MEMISPGRSDDRKNKPWTSSKDLKKLDKAPNCFKASGGKKVVLSFNNCGMVGERINSLTYIDQWPPLETLLHSIFGIGQTWSTWKENSRLRFYGKEEKYVGGPALVTSDEGDVLYIILESISGVLENPDYLRAQKIWLIWEDLPMKIRGPFVTFDASHKNIL